MRQSKALIARMFFLFLHSELLMEVPKRPYIVWKSMPLPHMLNTRQGTYFYSTVNRLQFYAAACLHMRVLDVER